MESTDASINLNIYIMNDVDMINVEIGSSLNASNKHPSAYSIF